MPISTAIPDNSVISANQRVKSETANKLFTDRLTSAANAQVSMQARPSAFWSLTGIVWGGLKKIGAGLKAAGNVVADLSGIRRNGKINYLDTYDSALKIARHGIGRLCTELWSLLKDETFPILGAWLKTLQHNWHRMTPYEAFKSLIEAVLENPRIKNMFEGIFADARAS